MDVERLPSGKFETNELVLELTILAYNILRMIGQESIGRKGTETKESMLFFKVFQYSELSMRAKINHHSLTYCP